jgi:hypothetical protein
LRGCSGGDPGAWPRQPEELRQPRGEQHVAGQHEPLSHEELADRHFALEQAHEVGRFERNRHRGRASGMPVYKAATRLELEV